MEIEILGWEKYNPRKDQTNYTWFRFRNDFFFSDTLIELTNNERLAWIYLLCQASQKNKSKIIINFRHSERIANVKKNDILLCIEKLEQNGTLKVDNTSACNDNTDKKSYKKSACNDNTLRTYERTNKRTNREKVTFDLESIYNRYPRKIGKSKGLAKLKAQIKTHADFISCGIAVKNYADYCQKENTEERFIKHFSSFITDWKDWIHRNQPDPVKENTFEKRTEQELKSCDDPDCEKGLQAFINIENKNQLTFLCLNLKCQARKIQASRGFKANPNINQFQRYSEYLEKKTGPKLVKA